MTCFITHTYHFVVFFGCWSQCSGRVSGTPSPWRWSCSDKSCCNPPSCLRLDWVNRWKNLLNRFSKYLKSDLTYQFLLNAMITRTAVSWRGYWMMVPWFCENGATRQLVQWKFTVSSIKLLNFLHDNSSVHSFLRHSSFSYTHKGISYWR